MKVSSPLLLAGTLTLAWGVSSPAHGTPGEETLTFDLDPHFPALPTSATPVSPAPEAAAPPPRLEAPSPATLALPIPVGATVPPRATGVATPAPPGLYGGDQSLAWGDNQWPSEVSQQLPAPPPISPVPGAEAPVPATSPPAAHSPAPPPEKGRPPQEATPLGTLPGDGIAITLEVAPVVQPREVEEPSLGEGSTSPGEPVANPPLEDSASLFAGGVDSLVARAVGSAEGTRTPEGHRTSAYYGHVDPGNGVWNLGTFSYQHRAASPEAADALQLQRLQRQTRTLKAQAAAKGVTLSQRELLNGIDLANQAPLAALDRGGYIDWLVQARRLSMGEAEGIVWARTRSFLDPDTQRWNAPGLGNTVQSITRDQARRAAAIDRALAVPPPSSAPLSPAIAPAPETADPALAAAFSPPRTYGPGEQIP